MTVHNTQAHHPWLHFEWFIYLVWPQETSQNDCGGYCEYEGSQLIKMTLERMVEIFLYPLSLYKGR